MLDFAVVSSLPLMAYGQAVHGQFIDLQRPSFGFKFSFGASHGFSKPERTHLNWDAIIAHEWHPQGELLPEYGNLTRPYPKSMHLSWVRVGLNVFRRIMTYYDGGFSLFSAPTFLSSQTFPRRL